MSDKPQWQWPWATWWLICYADVSYRFGGIGGRYGIVYQIFEQIVVLSASYILWRAWRWIAARWKIVRVAHD